MALGTGDWIIMGRSGTSGAPALPENTYIAGGQRIAQLHLKMGASGYPTAGISMPSYGSVGFYRDVSYYMSPVMSTALLAGKTVMFALSAGTTGTVKMKAYRSASGAGVDQQPLACTAILAAAQHFYLVAQGW